MSFVRCIAISLLSDSSWLDLAYQSYVSYVLAVLYAPSDLSLVFIFLTLSNLSFNPFISLSRSLLFLSNS